MCSHAGCKSTLCKDLPVFRECDAVMKKTDVSRNEWRCLLFKKMQKSTALVCRSIQHFDNHDVEHKEKISIVYNMI